MSSQRATTGGLPLSNNDTDIRGKRRRLWFYLQILCPVLVLVQLAHSWELSALLPSITSLQRSSDVEATASKEIGAEAQFGLRSAIGGNYENVRIPAEFTQPSKLPDPSESAFSRGKHLFHASNKGMLVEGTVFVRPKPFQLFSYRSAPDWKPDEETRTKTYSFTRGQCFWCPRWATTYTESACRFGTFQSGWFKDDHSNSGSLKLFGKSDVLKLRSATLPNAESITKDFTTTYFRCIIKGDAIPEDVEGILRVQNLTNLVFNVNPWRQMPFMKNSSIICLRAPFGTLKMFSRIQFASYYLEVLNISRIIMYEAGMTRGSLVLDMQHEPRMRPWLEQGRILITDIRDAFQRLYGSLSADVPQFSAHQGLLAMNADCTVRAKLDGFEWMLVIDLDEILGVGPDHSGSSSVETFADMVARLEHDWQYVQKSNLPLNALFFERTRPKESMICDICDLSISRLRKWVFSNESMLTEQDSNPPGKSAVRLVPGTPYPLPNTVGLHSIANGGAFGRALDTSKLTMKVRIRDYNVRHYKCLNRLSASCDRYPSPEAPIDHWPIEV